MCVCGVGWGGGGGGGGGGVVMVSSSSLTHAIHDENV